MRPPLDVRVDTGATLGEGSRVVLMPDRGGVGEALGKRLAKLGAEVLTIKGAPDVEELEGRLEEWKAAVGRSRVSTGSLPWTTRASSERSSRRTGAALHARVKLLAATMRALSDQVAGRHLPRQRHPPRRAPRVRPGTAPPPSSAGR